MEILELKGTENTPAILLDKKDGIFEIKGRSLTENPVEFYRPVFEWIDHYAHGPNATTPFSFKLEYFNTSTQRVFLDLLSDLKKIKGVTIAWYFHDDDEDMEEIGQEFAELVEIPFEFKTY